MKKLTGLLLIGAFLLTYEGCRKPYNPPAIATPGTYLVVEGVINPGPDSTTITLSRTVNLAASTTTNPVPGATVTVLSDQNTAYSLTDQGSGNYVSPNLNLDRTHQYRLKIATPDGQQYQSDLETVLVTPPIDSLGYNIVMAKDTGVQLYISTHDPTNTVHYYRWTYGENWEFFVIYPGTPLAGGPCFGADTSSDIPLASTAAVTKDALYQSPLLFMPSTSEKLQDRYRIVVRQYALSGDAYNFWRILKTNTEQLGSIFDAQPSQAPGNIHCLTNPAQIAVGYISVSTITTQTKFISTDNLPDWAPVYNSGCVINYIGGVKYVILTPTCTACPGVAPPFWQ